MSESFGRIVGHFHEKAGRCQAISLVVATVHQTADQREAPLTFSLSFLGRFFLRLSITADGRPTGGAPCCHPQFSNRRLALLPSALLVERSLRCQLGVLNLDRVLPSRTRTDALLSEGRPSPTPQSPELGGLV